MRKHSRSTMPTLAGLLALSAAALVPTGVQAHPFDGFYAGAEIGYGLMSVKESSNSPAGAIGSSSFVQDSDSASGAVGGLFAGYGRTFDKFYIGGEIGGALASEDYTSRSTYGSQTSQLRIKSQYQFGVSLRPGYLINDATLVYGRLGYQAQQIKVSNSDATVPAVDKTVNGLVIGAGVELLAVSSIALRLDYSHAWYGDASITDTYGFRTKYEPQQDVFKVGVAYHF